MARIVEVRKDGDDWGVYAEGKLLQGGLPTEEFALRVAEAVREVLDPYAGDEDYHHPEQRSDEEGTPPESGNQNPTRS
jgi:hypothetical protein